MGQTSGSPRQWTWATSVKLDILDEYLSAFTRACKRAGTTVYIDLFAGGLHNRDRDFDRDLVGSSRLAPLADPPFTKLRYIELISKAESLRVELSKEFPGRDIKVFGGDCNTVLPRVLADLEDVRWAPTFAFVDPDGLQVRWETLELLAAHKLQRSSTKVELWLLFPGAGLMRTLAHDPAKLSAEDRLRADGLFGHTGWWPIYEDRITDRIDASQARAEYVNLMRFRLEQGLGYRRTHTIELRNTRGTPMYNMIFATDSDAGDRIMASLYRKAWNKYPEMRQQLARQREKEQGVLSLFDLDPSLDFGKATALQPYKHEPPWQPRGWGDTWPEAQER
ncbi:MAG: three-Cys-motif partner protein TcmP [Acidimicrobiales bacterium]